MIERLRRAHDVLFAWMDRRRIHRIAFALLWSAALFGAILGTMRTTFKANDNVGIQSACQEGLEAPFMSPVLVRFLGWMYQDVAADVPWYGIFCYASLFWGFALLIHALSSIRAARPVFLPLTILLSIVYVSFLIRCGYNSSSMLLSGIAVLAFVAYMAAGRATKTAIAMCALGLAFAFLFRPRGAQGAMVFVAPAVLAWLLRHWRAFPLAAVLVFAAPIAIVSTVHTIWTTSWISDEYRDFREFNRKRGKFHAYPIAKANLNNRALFKANHWSGNEYRLFTTFFFFDEDVWNIETISRIFEMSVDVPLRGGAAEKLHERFHQFTWFLPVVLAGLLLRPRRRRAVVEVVGYLVYVGALSFVMEWLLRFPERVGDSMLTLTGIGLAWVLFVHESESRWRELRIRHLTRWMFGTCLAVATIGWATLDAAAIDYTSKRSTQFHVMESWFDEWFPGRHVLAQPAILLSADQDPLRVYDEKFQLVPTGWQTFSPRFYAHLRKIGLERGSQLLPFAIDNSEFFLVFMQPLVPQIVDFVKRQYGVQVKVREFPGLSNIRFRVFQLVVDPDPIPEGVRYRVEEMDTRFDVNGLGPK
ncbi:MAG: hypothetical protein KDB80_16570 [Planctomycetes bacterium]|nr:hypothetical protein [Planctomycetota bacterium]